MPDKDRNSSTAQTAAAVLGDVAAETEALMRRVGARVREVRRRRRLSRRVLSEMSGVSQRYLAQLEAGRGNISIALLWRVATALEHPMEALISPGPAAPDDTDRVAALFRIASPESRRRVLQILRHSPGRDSGVGNIALIGLRGAGKSTIGRMLGEALDVPFVELNEVIAEESGMDAGEVMALYGPEAYRRFEREALERVTAGNAPLVLAVAGGIVAAPETFDYLLGNYHAVWLRAAPEEHMARVRAQGDERPMAGNPRAMEELRMLLKNREALYARAALQVDTSRQRPKRILERLMQELCDNGFVEPPAGDKE